jgi:hypothetical protein
VRADGFGGKMSVNVESVERYLASLPEAPWHWKQSYEMATFRGGCDLHWALYNSDSENHGRTLDLYTILLASHEKTLEGQPISEQGIVAFIPWARAIIPDLIAEIKELRGSNANSKPKKPRSYSVVQPKQLGTRDERINWLLAQFFKDRLTRDRAASTAEVDTFLKSGLPAQYVGSLSKKISNIREWYRQQGIGELRCFNRRINNQRVAYYYLDKGAK